jgi:spore germination cell wall hydrolase CwlJ-like protein
MISKFKLALRLGFVVAGMIPSIAIPSLIDKSLPAKQELYCLAANIYFESRGEKPRGKEAVALVTLNRVSSKKYKNSVCSVVFQRKQFSWTHQQPWSRVSLAISGLAPSKNKKDILAWQSSLKIAQRGIKGQIKGFLPKSTLWYHANYVKPKWALKKIKVASIGVHYFYKS